VRQAKREAAENAAYAILAVYKVSMTLSNENAPNDEDGIDGRASRTYLHN
jgi:hypothetical protein